MKRQLTSFAIGIAVSLCTAAPAFSDPASSLAGEWMVDLSATPDQPYTQPMRLTLAPNGTVTGDFYNSTIEAGRWETARGRTCVSFRTSDGEGPYHTAACLVGNGVQGQTWAEHRDFLFNWSATRPTPPNPGTQ